MAPQREPVLLDEQQVFLTLCSGMSRDHCHCPGPAVLLSSPMARCVRYSAARSTHKLRLAQLLLKLACELTQPVFKLIFTLR